MMPHAHWLELVWLVCGIVGFMLTLTALLSANQDLVRVDRQHIDGNPLAMARAIVIVTRIVLALHLAVIITAAGALFLPPPPGSLWDMPELFELLVGSIVFSFVLVVHQLYGRIVRGRIFGGLYSRRVTDNDTSAAVPLPTTLPPPT